MAAIWKSHLLVAAIDIGTTHSGIAFSVKYDFKRNPLKITTTMFPLPGSGISGKTHTALLLNPDQSFNSFGYDAENNYSELAKEDEHNDYYYFRRFKTILRNNKNLRMDTRIKEERGVRTLPAIEVFSHAIRYLKDDFLGKNDFFSVGIIMDEIKFVLTIPAVCDDKAKEFILEAAIMGGIKRTQVSIISEPEAAYTFCHHYVSANRALSGDKGFPKETRSGGKCLMLNLGDETVDITVYQKKCDGKVDEPLSAAEVPIGGKSIDDEFESFIASIVGEDNFKIFAIENVEEYNYLFRDFERKKISFHDKPEIIRIPPFLLHKLGMREAVKTSPYGEDLHVIGNKLKISDRLFRRFFDPTIREILKRIDKILTEEKSHDVNDLFVVGGFAEYKLVQNTIREKFGKKRIIIPHQADYAVSRGSVLYGHIAMMPTVTRYTYGCQHWPMFNNKEHPLNKLMVLNGEIRCKDIFYTLQERGVTVSSGYKVSHLVQVLVPKDGTLNVTIYVSKGQEPRFIDDDGCTPLGTMTVHLASSMQGPVELNKTLTFQDNGIVLEITEKATGQLYDTTFPFLYGVM